MTGLPPPNTLSSDDFSQGGQQSPARPFTCPICASTFTRKTILNDHLKAHNNIRAWTCITCPSSFVRRSDLKQHERSVHGGADPITCEDWDEGSRQTGGAYRRKGCQRQFSRHSSLRRHRSSAAHVLYCNAWWLEDGRKLNGCGAELATIDQLLVHRSDHELASISTGLEEKALIEKPLGDKKSNRFRENDRLLHRQVVESSGYDPNPSLYDRSPEGDDLLPQDWPLPPRPYPMDDPLVHK
jgi:hypothetical protein